MEHQIELCMRPRESGNSMAGRGERGRGSRAAAGRAVVVGRGRGGRSKVEAEKVAFKVSFYESVDRAREREEKELLRRLRRRSGVELSPNFNISLEKKSAGVGGRLDYIPAAYCIHRYITMSSLLENAILLSYNVPGL